MESEGRVFEKRKQKAVYDIRIKRPCHTCDLIEWKHGFPDYWWCPLFCQMLFDANALPCTLGEKNSIEPCGDCERLIEHLKKIPEMEEGADA